MRQQRKSTELIHVNPVNSGKQPFSHRITSFVQIELIQSVVPINPSLPLLVKDTRKCSGYNDPDALGLRWTSCPADWEQAAVYPAELGPGSRRHDPTTWEPAPSSYLLTIRVSQRQVPRAAAGPRHISIWKTP